MASEPNEEMVETKDEGQEATEGASTNFYSSSPPSSVSQKPSPSSVSSNRTPSPDHFRRKTRDLPNIYNCHSCGLRFPDTGRGERLHPLDSQWRIVLLCKACLRAIRSADFCSYCFAAFGDEKEGGIRCRKCSSRVHLDCVPRLRGFVAASDLDPNLFVCIDCWALSRSPIKKLNKGRDSSTAKAAKDSLKDLVASAKCAAEKKLEFAERAKEKAVRKAIAAKRASEMARSALGLVFGAKESQACTQLTVDEKLALQLHLAINGSQRRSLNSFAANSGQCNYFKGGRLSICSVNRCSEAEDCDVDGKELLCFQDTFSEPKEDDLLVHVTSRDKNKEASKSLECNHEEIGQWEDQGSCSHTLVDSTGDENSVDSVEAPSLSSPSTVRREEQSSMPDRYLKKYCKRLRIKDNEQNGASAPLLIPVGK